MNALDAILTRRSCREFTDQPIEKEKLHQLLEAAMSGPSCVNAQDWSFVVVTDPEKLAQMADANGRPAQPLRKAAAGILVCGDLDRAFRFAKDYWCHCRPEYLPCRTGAGAWRGLAGHLASDGPGGGSKEALRSAGDHRAPLHHRPWLPGSGHYRPACKPLRGRPGAFQSVVNHLIAGDLICKTSYPHTLRQSSR